MPVVKHSEISPQANHYWRDVHHANDAVRCTRYELSPSSNAASKRFREIGSALAAVLTDAFARKEPLRVAGGRWSLSNIGRPDKLLLDIANHRAIGRAPVRWLSPAYFETCSAHKLHPTLISGAITINVINRELAKLDLALQTTGASDGQTLAGATATGTHGADLHVGALHDQVRAMHLVVSPSQTLLIQPSSGPLNAKASDDLGEWFGLDCKLLSDDELFHAALVHLGSLGIVLNLVVEAVPLYFLQRRVTPHLDEDLGWRRVLKSRDPQDADPRHHLNPDFLQLILHPYVPHPQHRPRAWLSSMVKTRFSGEPHVQTNPGSESLKSDIADLLPPLVHLLEHDGVLPSTLLLLGLRALISAQLKGLYPGSYTENAALPGVMFGPPDFLGIDFDPLRGASAEYVFDAKHAPLAIETILETLAKQAMDHKNQYLGGIGVRFVKKSKALLALNTKPMNCCVELQCIHTEELPAIHDAIGKALRAAKIKYGGHWGQQALNTPKAIRSWWGSDTIKQWKKARKRILTDPVARTVFASQLLSDSGLGADDG